MLFLKLFSSMEFLVTISLASNKHSRLCMNDNLIISISLNLPIVNTLSYFNRSPPIPYYFVVLAAVSLVLIKRNIRHAILVAMSRSACGKCCLNVLDSIQQREILQNVETQSFMLSVKCQCIADDLLCRLYRHCKRSINYQTTYFDTIQFHLCRC